MNIILNSSNNTMNHSSSNSNKNYLSGETEKYSRNIFSKESGGGVYTR